MPRLVKKTAHSEHASLLSGFHLLFAVDDVDAILSVIDEAYEILADDLRRERYRRALEAPPG